MDGIYKFISPNLTTNKYQKWKELLYSFLIYYFIVFLCAVLILATDYIVVNVLHHKSIRYSHFSTEKYIQALGLYKSLLIMTIKAPIIEELSFRLLLIPNRLNFSLSISFLAFLVLDSIYYSTSFFEKLTISLIIFGFSYIFYNLQWIPNLNITPKKLVFISSLCFGGMHIVNFSPIYLDLFFLYPIYVLPQIVLGSILGIIRIRNGFFWAVLLHILVNGSVTWYRLF